MDSVKAFEGFAGDSEKDSYSLTCKYKILIEIFEKNLGACVKSVLETHARMEYCSTKKDVNTGHYKGILLDNDSGYISQNVESNSSVETVSSDNRQMDSEGTTIDVQNVYVNEDTLLEQPSTSVKCNRNNHYEDYSNLFYMCDRSVTDSVLNSSVVSQNTSYSGFEGDESETSNISTTIPIATPILVADFEPQDLNNTTTAMGHSVTTIDDANSQLFITLNDSSIVNNSKEFNTHFVGGVINDNLKPINVQLGKCLDNDNLNTANFSNCIQTRIMDASVCGTSLFESFYNHLCGLYTRNAFPSEDLTAAINPYDLQISNSEKLGKKNTPLKSCYLQLETVKQDLCNSEVINTNPPLDILKDNLDNINLVKEAESHLKQVVPIENCCGTPEKTYKNCVNPEESPELFSDDEPTKSLCSNFTNNVQKSRKQIYVEKIDNRFLRRAKESLCGVPPPPSVTIIQMSAEELLNKFKTNEHKFTFESVQKLNSSATSEKDLSFNKEKCDKDKLNSTLDGEKSFLVTCEMADIITEKWPKIMEYRYHGLHHNASKESEDIEHLCIKYAEKYIGAETQSSCTVFSADIVSPSKRKNKFKRLAKSPGKRLSHLARRRITFSKDSLQSSIGSSSCSFIGARTRQIMVGARKCELLRRKSPKKKTPSKSPRKKSRTPSSSSKKRFVSRLKLYNPKESMDSVTSSSCSSRGRVTVTKRALFQSPEKGETTNGLLQLFTSNTSNSDSSTQRRTPRRALFTSPFKTSPSKMSISSLYPARRKPTPKRALFMSPEKSPSTRNQKRKRVESDDDQQSNKFPRSIFSSSSKDANESKPTMKSQSTSAVGTLQKSDIVEHRTKKLMWAVAEALRSHNIDMKHPQFKVFASVLARIIRHFLPNFFVNGPRPEGSSSESMLRIARQHVFAVTRGKTVTQIIRETENNKGRVLKPIGYVGLDKTNRTVDNISARNKENVLQDRINIIDSDRLISENGRGYKSSRGENVERIRRVINFGDDDEGIR